MAIQRAVSSFLNSISSITIPDKANLHQATSPHSTQTLPSKARNWKSTENTNSASTYQNTGPKTRSPCGPTKSRDKKSSVAFSLRATATFRTMLTRLFLPILQRSLGFIRMVVSSLSFVIVGRMLSRGVPLGCLRFLDPPNKYLWNLWKSELRWKALRGKDLVLRFDFFGYDYCCHACVSYSVSGLNWMMYFPFSVSLLRLHPLSSELRFSYDQKKYKYTLWS